MNTTYEWLIWNIQRDNLTGGVGVVDYRVRAVKDTAQAIYSNKVTFIFDEKSPDFISYEELTPEIIVEWVKNKLDEDKEPSTGMIYEILEKQLDQKLASDKVHGIPWSQ